MFDTTASQSKSAAHLRAAAKALLVVVGQLLAGVAGVDARELGHERPDGNHVRLAVAHRRHVAVQPGLVASLHRGRRVGISNLA